jgi:hypothetical protein
MLSFSRCIVSIESKQAASVHPELADSDTVVAQSEAEVEDLEVPGRLEDRREVEDTSCVRQGVPEEVHMFRGTDIPQTGPEVGHILQEMEGIV